MEQRIIYPNDSGGVAVVIPVLDCGLTIEEIAAKDIPQGRPWRIIDADDIPKDEHFWDSWEYSESGSAIRVNIDKAKTIAHSIRRAARAIEFSPHDEIIAKQIPGAAVGNAEAARAAIRVKYAAMQDQIDAAGTTDEIKAALAMNAG